MESGTSTPPTQHVSTPEPETPFLEKPLAPPWFNTTSIEKLAEMPLVAPRSTFPTPTFTYAIKDVSGRRIPQCIAHRGYKAKFPENTMGAFKGAVEVGAQAIETDIHLSKDGVVVLSHDATLKRCFGKPGKIVEHDWEYLSTLKTLKEPRQHLPRLKDLLEYLAQPGMEEIWVLLDIKLDNNADDVMRLIGETLRDVKSAKGRPWNKRVILGVWAAKYLPLCDEYLPTYPITHIGFSLAYASQFFAVPNISFNMLQAVLMGPCGNAFMRKAKSLSRPLYTWTVNKENRMRWAIKKEVDGVITDDPDKFLKVRSTCHWGISDERFSIMVWLDVWRICLFAFLFGWIIKAKHGFGGVDKRFLRRAIEE